MKKPHLLLTAGTTGIVFLLLPGHSDPNLQNLGIEYILPKVVVPPTVQKPFSSPTADKILIEKGNRILILMCRGRPLKTYRIALGREPIGKKTREGDGRTPEGNYTIDHRNPNSRFYLALHISYPNSADALQAGSEGVSPGGGIMIHGLKNGMKKTDGRRDWTEGCIAVTNSEMDEIWKAVPDGTPVKIKP